MNADVLRRTFAEHEYLTPDVAATEAAVRAGIAGGAVRRDRRRRLAAVAAVAVLATVAVTVPARLLDRDRSAPVMSPPELPTVMTVPIRVTVLPAGWRLGQLRLGAGGSIQAGLEAPNGTGGLLRYEPAGTAAYTGTSATRVYVNGVWGWLGDRYLVWPSRGGSFILQTVHPGNGATPLDIARGVRWVDPPEPLRFSFRLRYAPAGYVPDESVRDLSQTPPESGLTLIGTPASADAPRLNVSVGNIDARNGSNLTVLGHPAFWWATGAGVQLDVAMPGRIVHLSWVHPPANAKAELIRMVRGLTYATDPNDVSTWFRRPVG